LSVPDEGYFECPWWRLFWASLMKVIERPWWRLLSIPDEGYFEVPDEGYFERPRWRLFQIRVMRTKLDIYVCYYSSIRIVMIFSFLCHPDAVINLSIYSSHKTNRESENGNANKFKLRIFAKGDNAKWLHPLSIHTTLSIWIFEPEVIKRNDLMFVIFVLSIIYILVHVLKTNPF
jgi:hypothetical protein